jgi:hypothetical protein
LFGGDAGRMASIQFSTLLSELTLPSLYLWITVMMHTNWNTPRPIPGLRRFALPAFIVWTCHLDDPSSTAAGKEFAMKQMVRTTLALPQHRDARRLIQWLLVKYRFSQFMVELYHEPPDPNANLNVVNAAYGGAVGSRFPVFPSWQTWTWLPDLLAQHCYIDVGMYEIGCNGLHSLQKALDLAQEQQGKADPKNSSSSSSSAPPQAKRQKITSIKG